MSSAATVSASVSASASIVPSQCVQRGFGRIPKELYLNIVEFVGNPHNTAMISRAWRDETFFYYQFRVIHPLTFYEENFPLQDKQLLLKKMRRAYDILRFDFFTEFNSLRRQGKPLKRGGSFEEIQRNRPLLGSYMMELARGTRRHDITLNFLLFVKTYLQGVRGLPDFAPLPRGLLGSDDRLSTQENRLQDISKIVTWLKKEETQKELSGLNLEIDLTLFEKRLTYHILFVLFHIPNLRLKFSSSTLPTEMERAFSMPNVISIKFVGKALAKLPRNLNDFFPNLKILIIREAQFKEVPRDIAQIKTLETISIHGETVQEFSNAFEGHPSLRSVNLSGCDFQGLPRVLLTCRNLTRVNMDENEPFFVTMEKIRLWWSYGCAAASLLQSFDD